MRFPHLVSLALVLIPAIRCSAHWPGWRGPDANAVAPEGEYPVRFDPETNVQWEVDLPGEGTSTPTVWGDAIFLTASVKGHDTLCCYGLDGKPRWQRDLGNGSQAKHRSATGSNPSTAVDAGHVVAYFKSGTVACLDHKGKELWKVNLQKKHGKNTLWWDLGTSPVISSAGVVIAVMQDGASYLVTLDLKTGDEVWRQDRQYKRPKESDQAYTTPAVAQVDGKETIVTWGADYLTGHDAQTGALLWECGGFNPDEEGMWRVIASATIADGVAYVPYGRGKYTAAVRLGGSGDVTSTRRLWEVSGHGADVPSPVVDDGKLYILSDRGRVSCLSTDGLELWTGRLPRSGNKYFSSPLLAGGLLYCTRSDGAMCVASVDGGLNVVAENDLGEATVATPTPVKNTLLIRTRTKLYRFGRK